MGFKVEVARSGENTLLFNGKYIYSKYNPSSDVKKFIDNEVDNDAKGYLLIGLGLGYHLERLLDLVTNKNILLLLLDSEELNVFEQHSRNKQIINKRNVQLIKIGDKIQEYLEYQVILPNVWLKAVGSNHPLFASLEDIKVRQMSFQNVSGIMHENFLANTSNWGLSLQQFNTLAKSNYAVLVSAGPSLNQTIEVLKEISKFCFILAVGSALKSLLKEGIVPDAVIITDSTHLVKEQIEGTKYTGLLFYMATANHEMTNMHKGIRVILFQHGYPLSEEFAAINNIPLLETGGSVATTALSLLEFMGFQTVYLFGQDLGFQNNQTHANLSTSSKTYETDMKFQTVLSNNGKYINTYSNFNIFRRWFEQKVANTSMQLYNTAWNGAKIEGIPYISASKIEKQLVNASIIDYKKVMDEIVSTK